MLTEVFDPETLLVRGREAFERGDQEHASDLFLQAVGESRCCDNPSLLLHALMTQGRAACAMKRLDAALQSFVEAATLATRAGESSVEASALFEIADVLRAQNKPQEAEQAYHKALDRIQANPNSSPLDEARCLQGLAGLSEEKNPEEASLLWQGAARLYEAAGAHERSNECQQRVAFLLCC
jgi:tetratricopeptide (TPR) repeat protein